jgi:ribosomal protein S18 acetylase RimI-like enzyme
MSIVLYREVTSEDIPLLARIRGTNLATEEYWANRISKYMEGTHNPQMALKPRIAYLASADGDIIGFAAGHLTKRYNCDGELQWINVNESHQKRGIASQLIRILATWFIDQKAFKICVDVANEQARNLYRKNDAADLNEHWMVWNDIRTITKNSLK